MKVTDSSSHHGQRGELRQRYREGQEDQLGALGLVVNIMILWNTIYLDSALEHLRSLGRRIEPEDEARLSPLQHGHINVLSAGINSSYQNLLSVVNTDHYASRTSCKYAGY